MTFGNQDKEQKFSFPEAWKDNDEVVVVHQQSLRDIYGNGELVAVPHQVPVQAYPKDLYDRLSTQAVGAKTTGFQDLGLEVRPLHKTDEPDEDIQYATFPPAAATVTTEEGETLKKTIQAIEEGNDAPAAEVFKEKSDEKAEDLAHNPEVDEKAEEAKAAKGSPAKDLASAVKKVANK